MKKRIALIALLVAAVMLMTGCGKIMDLAKSVIGKSEQAKPAETKAPAQEIPEDIYDMLPDFSEIPTEKPAEAFVGEWVNAIGDDKVKVNADGTVEVNGIPGRITYKSDKSVGMMALDWMEADEEYFEQTYNGKNYRIQLGSLSILDDHGFLHARPAYENDTIWNGGLYYRKGEENPLESLFGTWTLMDLYGEGMKYKEKSVEEITVSPDGKLLVNGESIELEFNVTEDGLPMFYGMSDNISGHPEMEGEEMTLQVSLSGEYGRFVQGVKKAELSLENWKDFFEAKISYSVQYDDWGEVRYVSSRLYLLPKEGITILGFAKERFEVKASPMGFGMIDYNLKTNQYELRDMNAQEREKYGDDYFAGLDDISNEGRIQTFAERNPKMDTDPVTGYGFLVVTLSEDEPVINGDIATAPMVVDFKMEILRIIGTIYYK